MTEFNTQVEGVIAFRREAADTVVKAWGWLPKNELVYTLMSWMTQAQVAAMLLRAEQDIPQLPTGTSSDTVK